MRRKARSKAKMVVLENIWRDRDLSTSLKMCMMKVLVWTYMTYGAEGWTLRVEEKKKIQSCEMWCYKRLLNLGKIREHMKAH